MAAELVTGYYGVDDEGNPQRHVSSSEDGARQAGTVGQGMYVMETGDRLSIELENANLAVMGTGDVMMQGRHVQLATPTSFSIPVGTQNVQTNSLLVLRYERDNDGRESVTTTVLTGSPGGGDPSINEGSILDGDSPVDMPLYRVVTTGIETANPVALFEVIPSVDTLDNRTTVTPVSSAVTDSTAILSTASGSTKTGRESHTLARVWDWIKGKMQSVFGFSSSGVLGTANGGTGNDLSDESGGFVYVNDSMSPRTMDVIDGEGAIWYGFEADGEPETTGAGPRAGLLPLQYGGTGKDLDMRFGFVYVDPSSMPVTMNSMATKGVMYVNENGSPSAGVAPTEYGGLGIDASLWSDRAIPVYDKRANRFKAINAGKGYLYIDDHRGPTYSPVIPIEQGGTGASVLKVAQDNLGITELRDSLSQGLVFRGRVNDVHNLRQMGVYTSDSAANAPISGYVTYVCVLQNNDPKYPIIFGLAIDGSIWNCWKTTSGSFSSWRRIDA